METYYNESPPVPDAKTQAYIPHFSWANPLSYFSASTGFNPYHSRQMDPTSSLSALPIRILPPATDQEEFTTKKANKNKSQTTSKEMKPKRPGKKSPSSKKTKKPLNPGTKVEKKNLNEAFDEAKLDISRVPHPYCSCTGVARVCYKWGSGGWQSSCCTLYAHTMSEFPLHMSPSKPGARVAGRKTSIGAYGKLLCRLAAEGCDLSVAVDLKNYWAKHGTNKFVTIK